MWGNHFPWSSALLPWLQWLSYVIVWMQDNSLTENIGVLPWGSKPYNAKGWPSLWLSSTEKPSWGIRRGDGEFAFIASQIGVRVIFLLSITWKPIQVSPLSLSLEAFTWLLKPSLAQFCLGVLQKHSIEKHSAGRQGRWYWGPRAFPVFSCLH